MSSQLTLGAQSLGQGHSLPPSTNDGGDFNPDNYSPSNVGLSDYPLLDDVIANVLRDDFVFISLPPTLFVT